MFWLENQTNSKRNFAEINFQDIHNKELVSRLTRSLCWQAALFDSVDGRVQVGALDLELRMGDVVIVPPRVPFLFSAKDLGGGAIRASGAWISFPPESLPNALKKLPECEGVFAFIAFAKNGQVGAPKDLNRSFARIRSIRRAKGMLRLARLYAFLELLAGETNWKMEVNLLEDSGLSVRDNSKMMAIKRFAESRFASDLTRDEAARFVGMEAAAFSRFFSRTVGMKFVDYVSTLRVQAAARLLNGKRVLPVREVAERCGFRSQSVFNRQFKKRLGTTPSEYRKNVEMEQVAP